MALITNGLADPIAITFIELKDFDQFKKLV